MNQENKLSLFFFLILTTWSEEYSSPRDGCTGENSAERRPDSKHSYNAYKRTAYNARKITRQNDKRSNNRRTAQ